ncbi:MAG TPA: thiamine pyrophosphate-dependent dehydrogenase E1 component subunit alpha [Streptosporangiaceae bacterium]|nr:thiamine pyrophosphate-dependent dehydrogenase E1 component subunit alpha [Streptosporangiaceae bacterium]
MELAAYYQQMCTIRRFEEEAMALVQSREIAGSVHLCIGQEAIPVGACAALEAGDAVIGTYRGHGWAIARGVPLAELFAEMLGRASALNAGRGGSPYLMAPRYGFLGENSIVGAGLPMAAGAALARKLQGGRAVAVVSIGDGAMNQGAVHETLNMAAVLGLPLLLVVENNGYAEMTPATALTAVPAHERAAAYGLRGELVDGNDPAAVAQAVRALRADVLATGRPALLEAMTHRLVGHYSGDAQAYRPPGELAAARQADPITRLAALISETEADGTVAAADEAARADVLAALDLARSVPFPDPADATNGIYAEELR